MGKRSTKENKNIYQVYRENLGLTRDKASELLETISADRIEKIESEKSIPHPDEILTMAEQYKSPDLCNYYCSHECTIGKKHVPEIKMKDLSQIVLEMIASLNAIENKKNRLIEISVDGQITEDEFQDFTVIQDQLSKIAMSVDTLQLWVQKTIAEGKIDKEIFDQYKEQVQ
ncbi:MAG: helix-turn-helix transcriptional regulator [Spirochaetales bacterium]|nr:helix-turn-helix transcriptional regulator [Spirochaetales bacterium]